LTDMRGGDFEFWVLGFEFWILSFEFHSSHTKQQSNTSHNWLVSSQQSLVISPQTSPSSIFSRSWRRMRSAGRNGKGSVLDRLLRNCKKDLNCRGFIYETRIFQRVRWIEPLQIHSSWWFRNSLLTLWH